jgi:hypothetical protein
MVGATAVYEREAGPRCHRGQGVHAGRSRGLVCKLVKHGRPQRPPGRAEAFTLGVKAGVEAEAVWEGLRRGALGRMHYLHEGMPKTVFRGEYDPPMFSLALARKDIGLATELAREFDVPMPMTNLAEQIAIEAMNRGWGGLDNNVVFRLQEEAARVECGRRGGSAPSPHPMPEPRRDRMGTAGPAREIRRVVEEAIAGGPPGEAAYDIISAGTSTVAWILGNAPGRLLDTGIYRPPRAEPRPAGVPDLGVGRFVPPASDGRARHRGRGRGPRARAPASHRRQLRPDRCDRDTGAPGDASAVPLRVLAGPAAGRGALRDDAECR